MSDPSHSSRPLVIGCVMASMCMVAIEATIVSTVMPQIVAALGGLRFYSWVFASYLLAQTAMTVVFGNLADVWGRKPVMLAGVAIFVAGSLLAGFAWSMPSLILFRLVQGVGAGAMQPVAMTIVADLYPARERGKIQGYLASVWAVSAVLGPVVGGLIIHNISWAWVFWINLPVGVLAAAGFIVFLHENVSHARRSIDILGAACFTVAVTSLLVMLSDLGTAGGTTVAAAASVFCLSTVAFVMQERRAVNPLVSFTLWSHRPIAAANGVALISGMALMGLTTFVPVYVQVVLRRSPVVAGFALTTLLVGWPVGATLASRLFHRFALDRIMLTGSVLLPLGAAPFVLLTPVSSPVVAALGSLVMGLGMGLISVSSLVLIQEIVDWSQRGSATASNLFSRNLGSTLGATVLGAVFNHALSRITGNVSVTSDQLRRLLEAPDGTTLADIGIRMALQHALILTFWAMLLLSLATCLLGLLVPHVALKPQSVAPSAQYVPSPGDSNR